MTQDNTIRDLERTLREEGRREPRTRQKLARLNQRMEHLLLKKGIECDPALGAELLRTYRRRGDFIIEEQTDGFTFYNLDYQNRKATLHWQKDWDTDTNNSSERGIVPSTELYYAVFANLYQHRRGIQSKLIESTRKTLTPIGVSIKTSTRVLFSRSKIRHFHGIPDLEEEREAHFSHDLAHPLVNEGFGNLYATALFGTQGEHVKDLFDWAADAESSANIWNSTQPPYYFNLNMKGGEYIKLYINETVSRFPLTPLIRYRDFRISHKEYPMSPNPDQQVVHRIRFL